VTSTLAVTRPHYGGTLRVMMQVAPQSLDPAAESRLGSNLTPLLFDTLITLDSAGKPHAALSLFWQAEPGFQRWQLALRPGVRFSDGSLLTSEIVAASLRTANPRWRVTAPGEALVIETETPDPALPVELSLPHNAIVKRDTKLSGTGPFVVTEWQPGKSLTLVARDDYWAGRAYVDGIRVDLGKGLREQMLALDLGKADVVEVAAEQGHRAAADGKRITRSVPAELVALVFANDARTQDEAKLREALTLSIDRFAIKNVLLQGEGVPAATILPNWMTGYGFLFPVEADLPRARQTRNEVRQSPVLALGYDANDPLARMIAERVVLNGRDAGINLQVSAGGATDVRLVRISFSSSNPQAALSEAATRLSLPQPKLPVGSAEDLYNAEAAMLQTLRIIPLMHLPVIRGLSSSVSHWQQDDLGVWQVEETWLNSVRP
jgi:MarR-like DNA-binding transcriptional regulator SgrR of sgrS sRNA